MPGVYSESACFDRSADGAARSILGVRLVFTRSASGVARSRLGVRLVSFGVVTKLPAEYSEFARFQSECGWSGPEYTRSSIGFARSANGVAGSRLGVRLVSVGVHRHGLIQTAARAKVSQSVRPGPGKQNKPKTILSQGPSERPSLGRFCRKGMLP